MHVFYDEVKQIGTRWTVFDLLRVRLRSPPVKDPLEERVHHSCTPHKKTQNLDPKNQQRAKLSHRKFYGHVHESIAPRAKRVLVTTDADTEVRRHWLLGNFGQQHPLDGSVYLVLGRKKQSWSACY